MFIKRLCDCISEAVRRIIADIDNMSRAHHRGNGTLRSTQERDRRCCPLICEYVTARGVCQQCRLRTQCTQSESGGRTLKRHERQELLDRLRAQARSAPARRDIKIRQHFMEGSFAQATRFGLKRARWRGQWRVQIQDYLIAIVQNVELLIAHGWPKPKIALALADFKQTKCGVRSGLAGLALAAFSRESYFARPAYSY